MISFLETLSNVRGSVGELSKILTFSVSSIFSYESQISDDIILEPDRLYSAITLRFFICGHSEGTFFYPYPKTSNLPSDLVLKMVSYSIHVVAEYNLSGSKIICHQMNDLMHIV